MQMYLFACKDLFDEPNLFSFLLIFTEYGTEQIFILGRMPSHTGKDPSCSYLYLKQSTRCKTKHFLRNNGKTECEYKII